MDGERNNQAAGGAAVGEPLFTEEAEEEARPVVPLRQVEAAGPSSTRSRGGLPLSLNLLLYVILAGAAGAVGGYFVFRGQAPQPAVQASAETPHEPPATQPTVDDGTDTSTVKNDETPPRPATPASVEPERPATNTAESRPRDGVEERVEHRREPNARDENDEARPRREEVTARAESRRRTDENQIVRPREEKRVVRHDDEQDGRPKARLVGTITGRSRRY